LKVRGEDEPPVEEMLLAWAYHDTDQADMAKPLWAKAAEWLHGPQEALRPANLAGTLAAGTLSGAAPPFVAPTHPHYSAFDWETWYELDVLRRELAPRFAAQKP
jgi:hypothetical protein